MTTKPVVLIVDDSSFNLQLLGAFLGSDYDVCVATTGEEAIEIAPDVEPDIVILDVVLPGIDGHDVCTSLRNMPQFRDLPIIFSSGNGDAETIARGRAVGGTDFLGKPVNAAALRKMVAAHTAEGRRPCSA
ncbi:response regulator [Paracoccus sp. TK19116]|uniref:Response regulator n=1 Tax=Paracoccus albicereus TaxID=2922394 RepID=A0ABT1MTJ8_9RHOB|nr:response regulator [Paracoccus albicereus]MCQ0970186.1 response regulator [Paracoccus albicereus]